MNMMNRKFALILLFAIIALVALPGASANPSIKGNFTSLYGAGGTRIDTCDTCHDVILGPPDLNPFGTALQGDAQFNRNNVTLALKNIESLDSDADLSSNIIEIRNLTFPGNATDFPPEITSFFPASPIVNNAGEPRTFGITANQPVDVTWSINGTDVQTNLSVTAANYTNTSAGMGDWNVTAVARKAGDGAAVQTWDWIVTSPAAIGGPDVTGSSPPSSVNDVTGATRSFKITVNQTVNITWSINGTQVQFDENVTQSTYTNTSAGQGSWSVVAIAQNIFGTVLQVWDWIVSPPATGAPEITGFAPASPVSDVAGATRSFNVSVNQMVNITWFINGTQVQSNESVTQASYTNTSAGIGNWNVSAIAQNINGSAARMWAWNVVAPSQVATAPEAIISFNTATKDIHVTGTDSNVKVTRELLKEKGSKNILLFILTDPAGNMLNMTLENKKEGKELKASVLDLVYTNNTGGVEIIPPENKFKIEFATDKEGSIKELTQKIEVHKQFKVKAKFNQKKGNTRIKIDEEGAPEKEATMPGLVTISLRTEKGSLLFESSVAVVTDNIKDRDDDDENEEDEEEHDEGHIKHNEKHVTGKAHKSDKKIKDDGDGKGKKKK